jgi:aminoglycoside phosphotransferase family enzyme/predicted kinase
MDFLKAMQNPATYPHVVSGIRHIETHISHVFLTGDWVYKLKKPLRNAFLDYSTLDLRRACCQAELELNRRFAPEIYAGVVALARDGSGWNLEGRGETVEYAVKMREFPLEMVRSLGEELAKIHSAAPRLADLRLPFGSFESVAQLARDNFRELEGLLNSSSHATLQALAEQSERQLDSLRSEIEQRRRVGFVRDCHGDLHLGNLIWWHSRVQLFDGIEFNDALRWIDVMNDLGFVLMDLEEHRQAGLANQLLNGYLSHTGDYRGLRLLRFFKVYRAMVRAKVAAMRASQQSASESEESAKAVADYLAYAVKEFRERKPILLITHGVSGSGKTYQSEPLLRFPGLIRLRSDVERSRVPDAVQSTAGGKEERYSAARKQGVYLYLAEQAELLLQAGWSVLVDATFLQQSNRELFRNLAERIDVPYRILHFEASREVLEQRVAERARSGKDASEAGVEVLQAQLREYVELSELEQAACLNVQQAESLLGN